ncbi:MAG: hypothetical protein IJN65_05075 [Clostridia bacterium]|nr:hypothetical protein [Clostridia bacterium]
MKKVLSVLLVFCLMLSLCGCAFLRDVADMDKREEPKIFEFDDVSMELTTKYLRMDFVSEDYEFIVGNQELTIMGSKVEFDDTDLQELTVSEFAEHFRSLMLDDNPTEIYQIDGIPTMQYTATGDDSKEQTATVKYYKSDESFWIICFVTFSEDYEDLSGDIEKFAKSVKFS